MAPTRAAGSFDVAMIRVPPADQHDRVGALVVNPAGAGSSGLCYVPVWDSWSQDTLLARSDPVTFYPRGTEWSASIRCVGPPERHAAAATPSLLTNSGSAAATTRLQAHTRFCVDAPGDRTDAFDYYGGFARARALRPRASLLTASLGGHTAPRRSPRVAQQVTPYLVEVQVPGGNAC